MIRRIVLTVALLLAWLPLFAQVELIVRMSASADEEFVLTIERSLGKGNVAGDESGLFERATNLSPLIDRTGSLSKHDHPLGRVYTISYADTMAFELARSRWRARSDVEYVQPNYLHSLDTFSEEYNDTFFDSLAHLEVIRAPEAWETTIGSSDVTIGIVDTGVFFDHPDLEDQIWINPGEDVNANGIVDQSDYDGIDSDGNGFVDDIRGFDFVDRRRAVDAGDYQNRDNDANEDWLSRNAPGRLGFSHGTLVAGIAAAAVNNGLGIAGVAPGCKLVSIRAFGIDGLGEDDDVAAAIVYGADLGIDVLNLSFGDSYFSPVMQDAVRYAEALGTVIVASGGNVGSDDPHYPSDYPEVIGAIWLDSDGERRGSRASFGVGSDIGAPGSFVYTTLMPPPGEPSEVFVDSLMYGRRSGSSTAAPQVAGAAALLRSVNSDLSAASIRAILTGTAIDIGEPGWDHETAAGRLDVAAALELPFPAIVELTYPRHDSGHADPTMVISGSAVSPLFESYSVSYQLGDEDLDDSWESIVGPVTSQIKGGILAEWDTRAIPDTVITVRLSAALRNGQSIEDRRRVYLDRSEPVLQVRMLSPALDLGYVSIAADIASDDLTEVVLLVEHRGRLHRVASDRRGRIHGNTLVWNDLTGQGGAATAWVEARNVSGLTTTTDPVRFDLDSRPAPGRFREQTLQVPAGFLAPEATDIDGNGFKEIILNRYQDGWLGDTLLFFEWGTTDFRQAGGLLTNFFPRALGDTDNDGDLEVLLQVSAVTQLLEFVDGGADVVTAFLDTTGLSNISADGAVWGATLSDLDGDGMGEIVSHNRSLWRVLERRGDDFEEIARLENPTPTDEPGAVTELGSEVNGIAEPEAITGDFDGDGRNELLVSDVDGDFILYEATGDNRIEAVWHHQTSRYTNQGNRLARGDFDGDGIQEFWTYGHNWTSRLSNGEYETPVGVYYYWDEAGDNTHVLVDSLVLSGNLSNHGSLAATDFDRDGAAELVLAHPPDLYVLGRETNAWKVLFHRGDMGLDEATGIRSISMVTDDFDGDGIPEIVAAGSGDRMYLFEWSDQEAALPRPRWTEARAIDNGHILLSWSAPGADSVVVFSRASSTDGFSQLLVGAAVDSIQVAMAVPAFYALRGMYGSTGSELGLERWVRPHRPGEVSAVRFEKRHLILTFTQPLNANVTASQFRLSDGQEPDFAATAADGVELLLAFDPFPMGSDTLFWRGLVDAEGTPISQQFTVFTAPDRPDATLTLLEWRHVPDGGAELVFDEPLMASSATRAENYEVLPEGRIEAIQFDENTPDRVLLRISGRALGPTGLQTSVFVRNLVAESGIRLADEGAVATFVEFASTLDDVFVFPNPLRVSEHGAQVSVGGLPRTATLRVFTALGEPVTSFEELDGNGGAEWDLTDTDGHPVDSGVYIIQVESEGLGAVLTKVAVIR